MKISQKLEQVPNRLSDVNTFSHGDPEEMILSPQGPHYRTLTPIGEINELGNMTSKSNQRELPKFDNPDLATITKSTRRISITHANTDQIIGNVRKRSDESQNSHGINSTAKKQQHYLEDDYCQIMKQHQHPNLIIDLDDEDDIINQSLSQMPTINKGLFCLPHDSKRAEMIFNADNRRSKQYQWQDN